MANAKQDTAAEKAPAAPPMDAWTMATSLYVGIHETIARACEERQALLRETKGNEFAPGMRRAAMLIEALHDAERELSHSLHQIARSNGMPMPKVPRR